MRHNKKPHGRLDDGAYCLLLLLLLLLLQLWHSHCSKSALMLQLGSLGNGLRLVTKAVQTWRKHTHKHTHGHTHEMGVQSQIMLTLNAKRNGRT